MKVQKYCIFSPGHLGFACSMNFRLKSRFSGLEGTKILDISVFPLGKKWFTQAGIPTKVNAEIQNYDKGIYIVLWLPCK